MRIFALSLSLMLCACASVPSGPPTEYFSTETARAQILRFAGDQVPPNIVLLQTYGERWQLSQTGWGHKYTCTNSAHLQGDNEINFTYQEGNLVKGTLSKSDQCGGYSRWDIEGRYDANSLYVQFSSEPGKTTAIRRFIIEGGGRALTEDANLTLRAGAINTYVFPRSGQPRGDKIFTSSNFVARSNVSVASLMQPGGEAQRQQAAQREAQRASQAQRATQAQNSGGGFATFMNNALTVAAVVSDTSGQAYNNHVAQNVPMLAPLANTANAMSSHSASQPLSSTTSATASGGRGAVTPGSYAARPNTLDGSAACQGYSVDNYKEVYAANSNGSDVQLHAHCAGAYNYYWMYLNAIRQGYSQSDSDRTYAAFQDAARVVTHFYETAR